MDDEKKSSSGGLPTTGLLMMALVAASAFFVHEVPWQGSRPASSEPRSYPYLARQDVDARLWQDPLAAVTRGRDDAQKRYGTADPAAAARVERQEHDPSRLRDEIATRHCARDTSPVTIVAVMVQGGSYAESVESRRRARYAALAGFNELGYTPRDAAHLGYLLPPRVVHRDARLPEFVAYEWLEHHGSGASVLALWLDEYIFSENTVERVEALRGLLRPRPCTAADGGLAATSKGAPLFVVVGPAYSSTLHDMAAKIAPPRAPGKPPASASATPAFYAYGATADDAYLVDGTTLQGAGASLHEGFASRQLQVFRTVPQDGALAKALAAELLKRGIDPSSMSHCVASHGGEARKTEHIVLISEWDTLYGRSLPDIVTSELKATDCASGQSPWYVHRYSYLRGLDGQLPTVASGGPGEDGKATASSNDGKRMDRAALQKQIERPEGQSQLDYLRRLSLQLAAQDREWQKNGQGSIRAIGVLGSDVFDKLLVLQALRPQFENVVFFTTDLDARMLHPQEQDWARNLVVASGFGLQLRPELQRDILPFRDTYQTAVYFSTLVALGNAEHRCDGSSGTRDGCVDQKRIDGWLQETRVFEVGRTQPFQFGDTAPHAACAGADALVRCDAVHPSGWRTVADEPFSFSEGISIWPSEGIRFVAMVASVIFVVWSWSLLSRNLTMISEKMAFRPVIADMRAQVAAQYADWPWYRKVMRAFSFRLVEVHGGPSTAALSWTAQKFWQKYLYQGRFGARFARVSLLVLLYAALGAAVVLLFGSPNTPYRGAVAATWNLVILIGSVGAMLFVVFFVVDATVFCYQIIEALKETMLGAPAQGGTRWAASTRADYRARFDIDDPYLDQWILMDFIALRTALVAKLMYFPFAVVALMVLARSHLFDNWTIPLGLVLVLAASVAIVIACAVLLRRSAEGVRDEVLWFLENDVIRLKAKPDPRVQQLEAMMAAVRSLRVGAFAPYTQQPFVRALLLPLGGLGGPALLDYLTLANF